MLKFVISGVELRNVFDAIYSFSDSLEVGHFVVPRFKLPLDRRDTTAGLALGHFRVKFGKNRLGFLEQLALARPLLSALHLSRKVL